MSRAEQAQTKIRRSEEQVEAGSLGILLALYSKASDVYSIFASSPLEQKRSDMRSVQHARTCHRCRCGTQTVSSE